MIKKFSLITILFFLFTHPVFAQDVTQATTEFFNDFAQENEQGVVSNLGSFNTANINRVGGTFFLNIVGGEIVGLSDYDSYYGKGLIPAATEYTARLFDRPVKTSVYVADVLKNTNLVPQAYAQGIGFAGLNPILNIWKAFRNIAYFAFIIIFVVIGFMIMVRQKISSNAVVTIQEALPKIIITLILITFSYAIAGLMVDIMYLSIFILTGIFQQAGLITDASAASSTLFRRNIIGIGISYFTGFTEASGLAAESVGQLVSQVFDGVMGAIANVFFYLVFAVSVLIAVFRTFISLLMAYVGIIISTIFAPLQLLPNAFPGSDAFQKWLKGLFANVAVFPVAAAMILLGVILSKDNDGNDALGIPFTENPATFDYSGFLPPLLYGANAADGGSVGAVQSLIGFGIIVLLPEVVKLTKQSLEVKDEGLGEAAWKNATAGQKPVGNVAGAPFKFVGGVGKTVLGAGISGLTQVAGPMAIQNVLKHGPKEGMIKTYKQLRNDPATAKELRVERAKEEIALREETNRQLELSKKDEEIEIRPVDTPNRNG